MKRKRLANQNEAGRVLPRHLKELEHIQEGRTGFVQPSEGKITERTYYCLHQPNEQGKRRQIFSEEQSERARSNRHKWQHGKLGLHNKQKNTVVMAKH